MENLFELGLEKLLVARKSGSELVLGYINANDDNLGFCTVFRNVEVDGPFAPIGVLSSPLNTHCWDTLTFYGASYMQRKIPGAVVQQLQTIQNNEGVSLWRATNSYYKAFEFLMEIGITPIIIDTWSDIEVPGRNGASHTLRGPVVCNIPIQGNKKQIHDYLTRKIREELSTIRVREREFSDEEIMDLFKDYLKK